MKELHEFFLECWIISLFQNLRQMVQEVDDEQGRDKSQCRDDKAIDTTEHGCNVCVSVVIINEFTLSPINAE